jgi:Domain of unknown function (DUF5666)
MDSRKWFVILAMVALLPLSSCSGLKNKCTTNCGGSNATVSITMFDTPPTGLDLLSFTLPISALALTPSSGSAVPLNATVTSVEATRLQTDSALIVDGASVAAGSYTNVSITLGPTSSSTNAFINTSGSTISWNGGACGNGAVCYLPAGVKFTISVPLSLTLSSGQTQWIGLNLNLANAITTTNGLTVDFSQSNVLTATTSTRLGIPSAAADTIEDFIGTVTAYSASSSITVKSGISGQSLTAVLTSSTEYDAPSSSNGYSNCSAAPSCIAVGSTVSVDALLSANGTLTASDVDVLDATAVDEVEGVIYPTGQIGVLGMILADKVSITGNAVLGASTTTYGTGIFLNVSSANPTYHVDTKTLSPVLNNPVGFSGSGNLLAGQVVRAQVTSVASASNGVTATATNLLLRFSRLTGTVNNVTSSSFNFAPPSYVSTLDTVLTPPLLAYVYQSNTAFDGVTSTSDVSAGQTVAIRTLFLDNTQPTFAVAKARVP